MHKFKAMCRYSAEPGSSFGWVFITAQNVFEAQAFFKAQYRDLLMTHAQPA